MRAHASAAASAVSRFIWTTLLKRRDDDLAVARTVELAEEDPLPLTERELAAVERDEDLRVHQRCPNMGRRIGSVGILDVLPIPAVVDDLLERVLEILRHERIRVLVD